MASSPPLSAPWQSGLRGARANLLPGMALQFLALILVLGYYFIPRVHSLLAQLVVFRQTSGYAFGMASTGLCGGFLPFLYLHYGRRVRFGKPRYNWSQGIGLTLFWSYKGLEVDIWYRLQAHFVGAGHDFTTIAVKVVLDQFGYCPILAVPLTAAIYQVVDGGYDWAGLLGDIRAPSWYRRRVLPILISNLGVWIPAVAIIYALPTPLQLPLQNIILCFYTLVVAHQAQLEYGATVVAGSFGAPADRVG